jgi:Type II CAAX prenyl endopeptidase Rce1-like
MIRLILALAVTQSNDTVPRQRLLPLGSLFLPGLGQYVQHRPAAGLPYSGAALTGLVLYVTGDTSDWASSALPLDGPRRQAFLGAALYLGAGELSAYDTFRYSARRQQSVGRYRFLTQHEPIGRLFTAPFDPEFLTRWTTWVGLAYTGAIGLLIANDPDRIHRSLSASDVAFGSAVSLSAGIGEEALFRGWLYPALYQSWGEHFWPANGVQATLFGALHPDAGWFAAVIGGWAFYQGWLTRRNGWSVRESIFQHVWYDVMVLLLELGDARQVTIGLSLPLSF